MGDEIHGRAVRRSNEPRYRESGRDDEWEEAAEERPEGLFSSPARVAAMLGSLALALVIFSVAVWMLASRSGPQMVNPTGNGLVSVITNPNPDGQGGGAPTKGSVAPDFEWTEANTGRIVKLSSLRGKPVVVNFWGTWCPPCREEMPELQGYYAENKGQVEMIGVSAGPRDSVQSVGSFVGSFGYNWLFLQDNDYRVTLRYQITAVPSTFFIGPDGVISALHLGPMNRQQVEAYVGEAQAR